MSVDTVVSTGTQDYYVGRSVGAFIDVVLGRATLTAAQAGVLYLCDNKDGLISVYDTSGSRRGQFRLSLERRRVSRTDWSLLLQRRLAAHPNAETRPKIEAVLRELEAPSFFPLIDAIRADAGANLWIRTYDNLTSPIATWLIVSQTGKPLATIAMPRALDVLEIGADYVLGANRDQDGVEHLVLYDLRRS